METTTQQSQATLLEAYLEPGWRKTLSGELSKPYMIELQKFLQTEFERGKKIFPDRSEYFAAFNETPLEKVKVVILGQDPYHGPGQAHGLCFSVKPEVKTPPSLVNIYKEMKLDLGVEPAKHGYLMSWAQQGVLLLNSVLTVEAHQAASHRKKGWEKFTDRVVEVLNEQERPLVFILWGSYAQKKAQFVNRDKHLVLESVHPSPLSASRGFYGGHHFSKSNKYLAQNGVDQIQWELPSSV